MSREMIVGGREYLVGAAHHGHHDYDELLEMGADPAHATATHPGAPAPHPHHHHHHHQAHGHPGATHVAPMHPQAHHPMHYEPLPQHHPQHERSHTGRMRVVKEEPRHSRQFPIGFQMDNVAPGDEEDIEVKPQVLFRGERLAIAQSIARYFDVLDIKVGKDSQLAATGPLTGERSEERR